MIPSTNFYLTSDLDVTTQPSRTYRMNIDHMTINGFCDGIESVKQAVYKILNTERYMYPIYSWDYGIKLLDLYGKRIGYVCPELQRRITDALQWDDRITSVDSFEFDTSTRKTVVVTFTVHTIFGDVDIEKAVKY